MVYMATAAAADGRKYMTAIKIRVANGHPALRPSIQRTKKLRPFDPETPLASLIPEKKDHHYQWKPKKTKACVHPSMVSCMTMSLDECM